MLCPNHPAPLSDEDARRFIGTAVVIGSGMFDNWCTTCGAVALRGERASAHGIDAPSPDAYVWLRPSRDHAE